MRSKKLWIISGAAAVLLAAGGVTVLVAGSEPAPLTHEQLLKRSEDQFGKPPAPPKVEDLKDQLAQVQATAQAPAPVTTSEDPQKVQEDPQKAPGDAQRAQDDWQKAELLKQQIVLAEHAPSPMPTGHSSYVTSGKQP